MDQVEQYVAPEYAKNLPHIPTHRVRLANTPTPIHNFNMPGLPEGVAISIKRDDYTGVELSGNKIRKLEFLLADCLMRGCDWVVTMGGTQSNHCRTTAVAARRLGLQPHLLLRVDGMTKNGNILVDRLMDAGVCTISRERYMEFGAATLIDTKCKELAESGKKPYGIPVGGSNALGTWGYIDAVKEIIDPVAQQEISDVVLATGSGGTLAGLTIGSKMAFGDNLQVVGYGICDEPDFFYRRVRDLATDLCIDPESLTNYTVQQAKGMGYANHTQEELQFLSLTARQTGVVFDPTYTNKAVFQMVKDLQNGTFKPRGRVLLWHTGGYSSVFDKADGLDSMLRPIFGCVDDS